jgi:SnoaL-like domain
MTTASADFDFKAFKRAFESQDVAAWADFYADDADWFEYKHGYPPRSPRHMAGKAEITEFLGRVKASHVELVIEDEVIGPERAAFCLWCTLSDGRRIIENIIVHHTNGRITRQVDVESWD